MMTGFLFPDLEEGLMQNCARYANDEMIDSDRLFRFSRAEQNFLFFLCVYLYGVCIDN